MTDRDRVLERLRQGPVHTTELRRKGYTGNPSQRIAELRERGYLIEAASAPWSDAGGKSRPGTTYTLTFDAGLGDVRSGTANEPGVVESGGDPEPRLFDTIDIDIPPPRYRDPDALEDAA